MKMKKLISALLAVCLLAGAVPALAVDAGEARAVIGANLTDEQIADVYKNFGISRGDVTELRVTNADERKYLSGYVDDSVIGTNSISCVYIEVLDEGEGLDVTTSNINWCTSQMYVSALATAGITDAKIIVAAPFEVSGTAALTGVYMAYEDITGEKLDETAKLVSTQELTLTAELADKIGSYDSVEIVNELKLLLGETRNMTDEQLRAEIVSIASDLGVTLTEDYETITADQPFYGVYCGQSALPLEPEPLRYLTNDTLRGCTVYDYETGSELPVYDLQQLAGEDAYAVFLSGSKALLTITNPAAKTDRELVVFRDSFASSLTPLLAGAYAKITLVDIRYLQPERLGTWLTFDTQDVLFLYSAPVLNSSETIR